MWFPWLRARQVLLLVCAAAAGAGCDLIAEAGQTLVLANRGAVFGTGGNAQRAPVPAVRVQPGGTVVVEDADVFGGGILAEQVGQQRFGAAGPGILANGGMGTIRVLNGFVGGGSVRTQVSDDLFDPPAPGIVATDARIEIAGGMVRGGDFVSEVGPVSSVPNAPAVAIQGGTLRVSGGTLQSGNTDSTSSSAASFSVLAQQSQLEIAGGVFGGAVGTIDGRTRILGGSLEFLVLLSTTPQGCNELRGGRVGALGISGGRLIVAGTGLSLTPALTGESLLTGALEDGQAVSTRVRQTAGAVVDLVPPGSPGCP